MSSGTIQGRGMGVQGAGPLARGFGGIPMDTINSRGYISSYHDFTPKGG